MVLKPIALVWDRVERSRADSPVAVFHNLLLVGEALLKTVTAGLVAAVQDDKDRHRYRLCHKLVRANALGDWDEALADLSSGPALQHLMAGASEAQRDLTTGHSKGSYLHEATVLLQKCLQPLMPEIERLPSRFEGRAWYSKFVLFRNKTKGHGAVPDETIRELVGDFERSLRLLTDNAPVLQRQWVYLKRNLSGKYNVVELGRPGTAFDRFKSDRTTTVPDALYVDFGAPARLELIDSASDAVEFYYPNGRFRGRKCEWMSYISGTRKEVDVANYLLPASELPCSETEGHRDLRVVGRCFANLPPAPSEYVERDELESELMAVLTNDRHPIVTLVGRGGIGKTSLALQVLHKIAKAKDERFLVIAWLSARDIDLLPQGPKVVTPRVVSLQDITREVVNLLAPLGLVDTATGKQQNVEQILRSASDGAILFVFDNFETVQQPLDVFNWIDVNVRPPNKVLITTRHSDFRGDYEVEVSGMNESQCNALVDTTAVSLGTRSLVTAGFRREVYRESEGHPYVVKVLVGECAQAGRFGQVERIMASQDEILDALFERTYSRLSPAARRVFLTLSNWRSLVPRIGLDAALLRPSTEDRIDVRSAIDELKRLSFIDEQQSPLDESVFVSLPLVAAVFGKRKLATAPDLREIEEATRFLHQFGAMQPSDLKHGLRPRIERLFSNLSDALHKGRLHLVNELPVLELLARYYHPAWLLLADLWEESRLDQSGEQVTAALNRYLETGPPPADQKQAWERLALISRRRADWLGFLNSLMHIAELPSTDLATISGVANTFNSVFKSGEIQLNPQDKRSFARRLIAVMKDRIGDGDATDCSRLAWLLLQVGDRTALQTVEQGLVLDPTNEYCQKLKRKLTGEAGSGTAAGL